MTVCGIVAHESAMKGGELLKIPISRRWRKWRNPEEHQVHVTRFTAHVSEAAFHRRGPHGLGGSALAAEERSGLRRHRHHAPGPGLAVFSDRKVRVGIVGYGVCRFGAAFSFQDHPNVEVAAVSDLFPDRCAALARACRCERPIPRWRRW